MRASESRSRLMGDSESPAEFREPQDRNRSQDSKFSPVMFSVCINTAMLIKDAQNVHSALHLTLFSPALNCETRSNLYDKPALYFCASKGALIDVLAKRPVPIREFRSLSHGTPEL